MVVEEWLSMSEVELFYGREKHDYKKNEIDYYSLCILVDMPEDSKPGIISNTPGNHYGLRLCGITRKGASLIGRKEHYV